LGLCCLLLAAGPAGAAAPHRQQPKYPGADDLARRIDLYLEAAWKKVEVVPAAPADDAEWLRRVYLDLSGRIPSVQEVRTFLADRHPERRQRLVEKLLDGPRFSSHFATIWSALLMPEATSNLQVRFQAPQFERRIQRWLASGRGMDQFTRDLLTQPLGGLSLESLYGGAANQELSLFYAGKDYKPEEIASSVSRVFLGVNIGCAQCHNHPFAAWKREQFWSFTAFFGGIRSTQMGDFFLPEPEQLGVHEITIPGTDRKVQATYLDGKKARVGDESARKSLAEWVVSRDNPYFARAIVNRTWAYFFGTGLHEPIDDMAGSNIEPHHPALLDELARGFLEHDFDLRWLMRTITATRAYGLTSRRSHPGQDDPTLFARAALRGLTAQQLFDSLAQATGYQEGNNQMVGFNPFGGTTRGQFVTKFTNATDKPTEVQTSILQALTLMNGKVMADATHVQNSETLAAIADVPFMSIGSKIETLYLAALSRKPTTRETERMSAYVEARAIRGGRLLLTPRDIEERRAEALADIFWVLLNSGEFYLNH
jgi:hypothetical protein